MYTKRTTAIFCLFLMVGGFTKSFCNQIINHIENQWNETASTCQLRKLKFYRSHNNSGRYVRGVVVRAWAWACVYTTQTLYFYTYTFATIKMLIAIVEWSIIYNNIYE